jgi:hypothetical protein
MLSHTPSWRKARIYPYTVDQGGKAGGQGCSTLFGGKRESLVPQVGAERRRQADGRIPKLAHL